MWWALSAAVFAWCALGYCAWGVKKAMIMEVWRDMKGSVIEAVHVHPSPEDFDCDSAHKIGGWVHIATGPIFFVPLVVHMILWWVWFGFRWWNPFARSKDI